MKLIRKSVFETNSSSCHSLTLGSGDTFEGYTPNDDNLVVVELGEFGWSQETYNDVHSRLSYVYLYIRDWSKGAEDRFMEMFKKVVCEHTGASDVVPENENKTVSGEYSWYNDGYIDHQSVESRDLDYLFKDEATLKQFLFGSGSYIETDNDNH